MSVTGLVKVIAPPVLVEKLYVLTWALIPEKKNKKKVTKAIRLSCASSAILISNYSYTLKRRKYSRSTLSCRYPEMSILVRVDICFVLMYNDVLPRPLKITD
jgi:hypothetical protein